MTDKGWYTIKQRNQGKEKIFCVTYLETKSLKTAQAKFCRNFNNYPLKSQIHHGVHKFQAMGSVNNPNKKAENPDLAGCWLKDVQTMWMQWEILLEGLRKRLLPEDVSKNLVFTYIVAYNLKEYLAVPMQNPDQA